MNYKYLLRVGGADTNARPLVLPFKHQRAFFIARPTIRDPPPTLERAPPTVGHHEPPLSDHRTGHQQRRAQRHESAPQPFGKKETLNMYVSTLECTQPYTALHCLTQPYTALHSLTQPYNTSKTTY